MADLVVDAGLGREIQAFLTQRNTSFVGPKAADRPFCPPIKIYQNFTY
jgi:hypothetical protein